MHSVSDSAARFEVFSRPLAKPKPLKEVQASLGMSYTPSVVEAVSKQLFSDVSPEEMISPAEIDLSKKLAQTFQSAYGDLKKASNPSAARRAFKTNYGKTVDDLKAATERDSGWLVGLGKLFGRSSSYEKHNVQLKETADETAQNFVFFDNVMQKLVSLDPQERNDVALSLREEGLSHLCGGADPYGAKALLREIIHQVLRVIEPYLPESVKTGTIRTIASIEKINPVFQQFNKAITDYRASMKAHLECEASLKAIDTAWNDPWTMVESDSEDDTEPTKNAEQLKNQEQTQLQEEKLEMQATHAASLARMHDFLNNLPVTLSPLLVQTCALYQMVAVGDLKPHQVAPEMLRNVHEFADFTMVSAAPNSSGFCKAQAVFQLTTRELQRRQDKLNADQVEAGKEDSSGFMHVSIPTATVVEGALVEIHEGVSDDAFDIARRKFAGNDVRTEAIALLQKRQEDVIAGSAAPATFNEASQELLLQLQLMNLSPTASTWEYLFTFEGGQKDAAKAEEQVDSLNATIGRLDESLRLYRTNIDALRQQMAEVAESHISSSLLGQHVSSTVTEPLNTITEVITGPQTRLSIEKAILKQERAVASCEKTLLQAKIQKEVWQNIIADIQADSSFMKRLATYQECVKRAEKERLERIDTVKEARSGGEGIEMVPMGSSSSRSPLA